MNVALTRFSTCFGGLWMSLLFFGGERQGRCALPPRTTASCTPPKNRRGIVKKKAAKCGLFESCIWNLVLYEFEVSGVIILLKGDDVHRWGKLADVVA